MARVFLISKGETSFTLSFFATEDTENTEKKEEEEDVLPQSHEGTKEEEYMGTPICGVY